jgi:hypothetical protein
MEGRAPQSNALEIIRSYQGNADSESQSQGSKKCRLYLATKVSINTFVQWISPFSFG